MKVFSVLFQKHLNNQITGLVVAEVEGQPVVIASCLDDNSLKAFGSDGQQLWQYTYQAPVNVLTSGVLGGKHTILAGMKNAVIALNLNGALRWTYEVPEPEKTYKDAKEVFGNGVVGKLFGGLQKWGETSLKVQYWGVVAISVGSWKGQEAVLISTQYDPSPYILSAEGFLLERVKGPLFYAKFIGDNKLGAITGIGAASYAQSCYTGNVPLRIVYSNGTEGKFTASGGNRATTEVQITSRMKPYMPLTAGIVDGKPTIVFGKPLERYFAAYDLNGRKIWTFDTGSTMQGLMRLAGKVDQAWGILDIIKGRSPSGDAIVAGSLNGRILMIGPDGKLLWEDTPGSNVNCVAYGEWQGRNILVGGLYSGDIVAYSDGPIQIVKKITPVEMKQAESADVAGKEQYPCLKCGGVLRFDPNSGQYICDTCGDHVGI